MTDEQKALTELTLTEIAARIARHLRRIEADRKANPRGGDHAPDFYCAGASRPGAYVSVWYVSFQGGTNLTRAEALHYLRALDAGYVGRHYELFREDPPPTPDDPEVRFVCLIRYEGKYQLYGVHRRTEKRVYGETVAKEGGRGFNAPSFVDRAVVVKWQATQEDLDAIAAARAEMELRFATAREDFKAAVGRVVGNGDDGPL